MSSAVVTGAARGLGFEIARVLLGRQLDVTLADIDGEAVSSAVDGLGALGGHATAAQLDVCDEAACIALARDVAGRDELSVWVNNAGVLATGASWTHAPEIRNRMFEVNTFGTINGTFAALEQMRRAGRGHIVNVVSLAGLGTPPGETVYAASKHAAISFSLGTLADLRAEGIKDIHISALCPDGIWTPMLYDKLDDPAAAPSFSGTLLQPGEVAAKVADLLDKPKPVLAVPRSRGVFVRLFDAFPGLSSRATRLWLADARRRQKRWKKKLQKQGRV